MPPSEHEEEKIERLRRAMYSRSVSDTLKERPRRVLEDDAADVGEEWKAQEERLAGMRVAPRYIGATRAALWWVLVVALGFFVVALGFFTYLFVFGKDGASASSSNIDIFVSGPPEMSMSLFSSRYPWSTVTAFLSNLRTSW